MKQLYIFLYSLLLTITAQGQTTLVQWNFNSNPADASTSTGSTIPNINVASGSVSALGTTSTFANGNSEGGSTDPTTTDDSGYNLTGFPTQGTGNQTKGLGVGLNTTGYQNIRFSFDLRYSNASAKLATVQYSINGGTTWASVGTVLATAGDAWKNSNLFTLPANANNIANLQIRVVSTFSSGINYEPADPATANYATNGTWRFDMVTLRGDVIPMPVNLVSFTGKSGSNTIKLNWVTAWEKENQGFDIQKGKNTDSFESIGFVVGNSSTQSQSVYEFTDADVLPETVYYYRLKQKDFDGQFDFSKIIAVRVSAGEQKADLAIFPNPNNGNFSLSTTGSKPVDVQLFTVSGAEVPITTNQTNNSGSLDITAKNTLPTGLYFLNVKAADGVKPTLFRVLIN